MDLKDTLRYTDRGMRGIVCAYLRLFCREWKSSEYRMVNPVALKTTPLHAVYGEYGGKTVEFGGWDMPVQFQSILQEHEAVRSRLGLFDVSHMGEFACIGEDAVAFLQGLVTNDVSRLKPGRAMYSPMVNEQGGTIDDLLIYCFSRTRLWIVVNAGNIDKDWAWLTDHSAGYAVQLEDKSDALALLALQGPLSLTALQRYTTLALGSLGYYHFLEGQVAGVDAVISRTGYTGEDGFELYVQRDNAEHLWRTLLAGNADLGIAPCGLGARDTLRLEARLPLYGHELTDDISPLEAGLQPFVKWTTDPFIGQAALAEQKQQGIRRRLVGLIVEGRGIPRAGQHVFQGDTDIGFVTSGTHSPTLRNPIALALVNAAYAVEGTVLNVDIRGKRVSARVVNTPFYKRAALAKG